MNVGLLLDVMTVEVTESGCCLFILTNVYGSVLLRQLLLYRRFDPCLRMFVIMNVLLCSLNAG